MGRMLEALKNKDTGHQGPKDKAFFDDTPEHAPAGDNGASAEDGFHYIEVGPNKKMEGSAQVMAVKHAAQPRVQPPHQSVEKIGTRPPIPMDFSAFTPAPARTMAVAFEPWPAVPAVGQGIAAEIITYHHPEHPISRQYANLALKLQEGWKSGSGQIVLLAGSRSQVGTTTVLLNLAVAAVRSKVAGTMGRIALVDANWRRPGLAQRLGLSCTAGLQDVLLGRLALERAVVQTAVPGLQLLPGQSAGEGRPFKAEAVRWLFDWLGEHFSLVLVDCPPPGEGSDLSMLTSACDGIYLIVPEGESSQTQRSMAHTLSAMGGRLRGLFHTSVQS